MIWTAHIDGAVSFSDVRIEGELFIFPETIDKDYNTAILTDAIFEGGKSLTLMVSKDGKNFSIGVTVEIEGKQYTADDLGKMLAFKIPLPEPYTEEES